MATMKAAVGGLGIRACRVGDVARLRDLLKVCWHAAYDGMLGEARAAELGGRLYAVSNLGLRVAQSRLSRASTMLVATLNQALVGLAQAQRDGDEVILYSLYVHPAWQGQGIGSALLDAVIAEHAGAKAIRLEVLRDNLPAIGWYKAKGFQTYGETASATGTVDVPSVYMDKALGEGTTTSAARE